MSSMPATGTGVTPWNGSAVGGDIGGRVREKMMQDCWCGSHNFYVPTERAAPEGCGDDTQQKGAFEVQARGWWGSWVRSPSRSASTSRVYEGTPK